MNKNLNRIKKTIANRKPELVGAGIVVVSIIGTVAAMKVIDKLSNHALLELTPAQAHNLKTEPVCLIYTTPYGEFIMKHVPNT